MIAEAAMRQKKIGEPVSLVVGERIIPKKREGRGELVSCPSGTRSYGLEPR